MKTETCQKGPTKHDCKEKLFSHLKRIYNDRLFSCITSDLGWDLTKLCVQWVQIDDVCTGQAITTNPDVTLA